MLSRIPYALVPLVMLLASVPSAEAQEAAREMPFPAEAWSLAFSLPSGGGASLGAFKLVGPRTNLGLNLTIGSLSSTDATSFDNQRPNEELTQSTFSFGIEPTVRQYVAVHRTLAPYIHGNLLFSYGSRNFETTTGTDTSITVDRTYRYGIGVGFGIEWVPLERISIGGHTGFELSYFDGRSVIGSAAGTGETESSATRVDTFVSALVLQLYF